MSIIYGPGLGPAIQGGAAADKNPTDLAPIIIQALPGQTGPLLQFLSSTGKLLAQIDAGGNINAGSSFGQGSPNNEGLGMFVIPSDANATVDGANLQCGILQVTAAVALTATRNVIVPVTFGGQYIVLNNTAGLQSIQIIGATGTGVTIGSGKRAIVYCDGTNWVRVTPDT